MISPSILAGLLNIKNYGWIPDPVDTRDRKLSTNPSLLGSAGGGETLEINNSIYFRQVSNQSSFPSCTANATADAWESMEIVQRVLKGMSVADAIKATSDLSRMYIWHHGRQLLDPPQGYNASFGCHNRLTMDVICRFGVCTEAEWPYIAANAAKRPSIMAERTAMFHRSAGFYSIPETGAERHSLILLALMNKHAVIFGTALGTDFGTYKSGILQIPGKIDGLHAMIICGWSSSRNAYKVRNSWGTTFGENGYAWMSREYIDDYEWTHSLWVPTYMVQH